MCSDCKTVRPKGARTCSWQNHGAAPKPPNYWDSSEEYDEKQFGEVMLDLSSKIPKKVRAKAYADFDHLMTKAQQGKATFGRGDRFDTDVLDCVEDVLELKWKSLPPRVDDSPYVGLRLYFSEPKKNPGMLLKLKLVCKIPDTTAQDKDAQDAQSRFDRWLSERS